MVTGWVKWLSSYSICLFSKPTLSMATLLLRYSHLQSQHPLGTGTKMLPWTILPCRVFWKSLLSKYITLAAFILFIARSTEWSNWYIFLPSKLVTGFKLQKQRFFSICFSITILPHEMLGRLTQAFLWVLYNLKSKALSENKALGMVSIQ